MAAAAQQPTSWADAPDKWMARLVTAKTFSYSQGTLRSVHATCKAWRDAVRQHCSANFSTAVPLDAEDFPHALQQLCLLLSTCRNVFLVLSGPAQGEAAWSETDPSITHLLAYAKVEVGEAALANIKEVQVTDMELASLVPVWLTALCPGATNLRAPGVAVKPPTHRTAASPPVNTSLTHIMWYPPPGTPVTPAAARHVREQLAALPSLTNAALPQELIMMEGEHGAAGGPIHAGLTRLYCFKPTAGSLPSPAASGASLLARALALFPGVRELRTGVTVDDAGLDALLGTLPGTAAAKLQLLKVSHFDLKLSHVQQPWPWPKLEVDTLHVDSFALLPLERISSCKAVYGVAPGGGAQEAARVAQALARWAETSREPPELKATIKQPEAELPALWRLMAALPAERQRTLSIASLPRITSHVLSELALHLPSSVQRVDFWDYHASDPDVWGALLPSLPASVRELSLVSVREPMTFGRIHTLCCQAVRPIALEVWGLQPLDAQMVRLSLPEAVRCLITFR